MTVVFGFLIILVLFMNLVASMIRALGWDKELQEIPQSPILQVSNDSNSNPAIVAAIASAVEQYRREH
jgi:sodium pump decarboxylase gamma subunit